MELLFAGVVIGVVVTLYLLNRLFRGFKDE